MRRLHLLLWPLLSLLVGSPAHAHVRLDASTPAAGDTLHAAIPEFRIRFSLAVEPSYTRITLIGPHGDTILVGPTLAVEGGGNREFVASLAGFPLAGEYALLWRTAGADGHVLEGSVLFLVAPAAVSPVAAPGDDPAGRNGAGGDRANGAPTHAHEDAHQVAAAPSLAAAGVAARALHFAAIIALLGGVFGAWLVLPRSGLPAEVATPVRRALWRFLAAAAALALAAAVLRLWHQSASLHGADQAWNPALLSILLTDTGWGRAWLLHPIALLCLAAALATARPPRDRAALALATGGALLLALVPPLTGHAAGIPGLGVLVIVNDAIHVVAAGTWMGLLALLVLAAFPATLRASTARAQDVARLLDAFSPVALGAATVVALSGLINGLVHFDAVAQLWQTDYGRALLAKLAVVSLVVLLGFYNWRIVRRRVTAHDRASPARRSAALELAAGLAVIAITAVLVALPTPTLD